MFSVITNIYNNKTKGPNLMEIFTTGKLKKFFLTTRDVRCVNHGWNGTLFNFLSHTRQHGDVCGKNLNILSMCAVSPVVHTSNISLCQKKKLFSVFLCLWTIPLR